MPRNHFLRCEDVQCVVDRSLEIPHGHGVVLEASRYSVVEGGEFYRLLVDSPPLVKSCDGDGEQLTDGVLVV